MKNFIQPGKMIDVAAPADVLSGAGVMIGGLFGVAANDALSGEIVPIGTEGVYELPCLTTDNMAVGEVVNWNNSTKELQEATSTLDGVAIVVEDSAATVLVVKVKLIS